MKKREPLMSEEHFEGWITSRTDHIKEYLDEIDDFKNISSAYYTIYLDCKDLINSKYSAGYLVEQMRDDVQHALNWLIRNKEHPDNSGIFFDVLDFYVDYLQLYALGVIFNIEKQILQKLLTLIGHDGEDALLDKLALSVLPDRKQGNTLQHPKAYQSLFDAINATKEEQSKLMQKFLKGWYKSMRKCSWHDRHLGQGKYAFTGYWCWEAAMATILYEIDDSSYRDMPFYPKDMVEYARQQKL
ncbi:PoNe immunity protein domain-containing protein [Pedobacter sp. N23S346]|uniref:PoNi-like cognate immunity protein n=1 Tax=Pedobacter sp. N23S346 TaxID=3402750 RepID=UPI003AD10DC9